MPRVVAVPDQNPAAIFQRAIVALRADPNRLERSCGSLDLLLALDVGLNSDGLAAVVERKAIGGIRFERKAGPLQDARRDVGYTSRNVVLHTFGLAVL